MDDPAIRRAVEGGPLADLPVAVVGHLLAGATLVRASAGTTVYRPGESAGLHLVVTGLLRVALASDQGRQVTIRYARAGDVLGVPVVVGGAVPTTVHAVTDIAVLRTVSRRLAALARGDARVGIWMAEELTRRIHGLLVELARNTFLPVQPRLARHLLDLAADTQVGPDLFARVSQRELADATGTVREVVTRTLAGLKDRGFVQPEREGVRILDPAGLSALAEAGP